MKPKLNAAFRKWFGKSKVVDANGQPLVVYRGDRPNKKQFTGREDKSCYIQGNVFFTDSLPIAKFYTQHRTNYYVKPERLDESGGLYRVYLSLQRPLRVDAKGDTWFGIKYKGREMSIDYLAVEARKQGYDGLIVSDVVDQAGWGTQYVAFHPSQVKSVDNDGTWDTDDQNIASNPAPQNRPVAKNALMAKPDKYHGMTMSGVVTHPGFHTGSSMTVCQPYAQAKVSELLPNSWGRELQRHVMRDYPVILELDMQGMPFTIDFDAANWFNDAVQKAISESEDFDSLVSYLDFKDTEEELPDTMLEALFYLSGANPDRAVYSLRNWLQDQPDPEEAFARIKRDGLPDELLAKVSGQFRYVDDVPSGRIVTVHYIRPVFDNLFPHYEDPDWHHDKIIERIEALGYDTVTKENIYNGSEVLSVVQTVDVGPKLFPVENQRIEFHGTSWLNLLSAAPELADVLPLPPKPFWRYDPSKDDKDAD